MRTALIKTAIVAVILVLSLLYLEGKNFNLDDFKEKSPGLLALNNAGTEFWLTFNPAQETPGGKNDLKLFITSAFVTTVSVEIPGKGYLRQQKTKPNEIIEFTLTPYLGQSYRKSDTTPPASEQIFGEFGVHVYTNQPIICYAVTQYQNSGEGYLAIPVSALGKNYIVSSWADDSDNLTRFHPSYTAIVSPYDNNRVRVTLGGTLTTKTKGGMLPGETRTYTMYKGDVLLLASEGNGSDLSGTLIRGTKPVAVVSSNYCADVPENSSECNFITEMEVPIDTWGTTYFYTPVYSKKNNSYVKIFAKEAGTTVYRNSIPIAALSTGGGILDSGWIKLRADAGSPRPIVFSGNKPINVVQYNTSESDDSVPGKPFMMNLTPLGQFQKEIMFCTPEISSQIYNENYVNVVYQSSSGVLIPDDLMLARYENGAFNWQKVSSLTYTLAAGYIAKNNNKYYYYAIIRLPDRGVYKLKADNPLAAYTYGFSENLSYGFAASSAFRNLESMDTLPPKPTFKFCKCCFEVEDGLVEDMPRDSSRSNLSEIIYNAQESFNFRFSYEDFVPGEDSATKWQAWVIDKAKDARAVITFSDRAGNDTTITLDYISRKIAVRPELDFGLIPIGSVKEMTTWLVNLSANEELVIDSLSLKSLGSKGFELLTPNLPFNIPPLDSIQITVRFSAAKNGEFIDTIGVRDTCHGFRFESGVKAKVGNPMIYVSYWDYGDVPVNTTTNGSIQIKNIGDLELVITGYTGPRQLTTFIPDLPVITIANPLRLAPNQMYTFDVLFLPTQEMRYTDSIFFISNSIKIYNVDSVGDLNGRGIRFSFIANSYDWGNRRIDRSPEFPAAPYDPDNGYEVIKLENWDTKPVTIRDIKIISDINGSAFEFDRSSLTNRVLPDSSYIIVPVRFHPTVPCPHELIFEYDNSANSKTQTILRGLGTVPRIETKDIDFGSSVINDYSNPVKKKVRFTNLPLYDWRCGDTLTITDLQVQPIGNEISTGASWGTEGFRYNKGFIQFPIKLAQGESLEFEAEFVANKESQSTAYLVSVSDAETDVSSKWTGRGIIDEVIDNSANDGYILYPIPADDFLSINFKDEYPKYIRLFDSFGNVVYENRNILESASGVTPGVVKIRTNEFANGIYFLKVGDGVVRKVVVVH